METHHHYIGVVPWGEFGILSRTVSNSVEDGKREKRTRPLSRKKTFLSVEVRGSTPVSRRKQVPALPKPPIKSSKTPQRPNVVAPTAPVVPHRRRGLSRVLAGLQPQPRPTLIPPHTPIQSEVIRTAEETRQRVVQKLKLAAWEEMRPKSSAPRTHRPRRRKKLPLGKLQHSEEKKDGGKSDELAFQPRVSKILPTTSPPPNPSSLPPIPSPTPQQVVRTQERPLHRRPRSMHGSGHRRRHAMIGSQFESDRSQIVGVHKGPQKRPITPSFTLRRRPSTREGGLIRRTMLVTPLPLFVEVVSHEEEPQIHHKSSDIDVHPAAKDEVEKLLGDSRFVDISHTSLDNVDAASARLGFSPIARRRKRLLSSSSAKDTSPGRLSSWSIHEEGSLVSLASPTHPT